MKTFQFYPMAFEAPETPLELLTSKPLRDRGQNNSKFCASTHRLDLLSVTSNESATDRTPMTEDVRGALHATTFADFGLTQTSHDSFV